MPRNQHIDPEQEAGKFRERLIEAFASFARDLPWRQERSPYRVWISEIILQQTTVQTGIPYFERFMESFPDVETLAAAAEDDVLKVWEGLGYYSRARNLHKCAQWLVIHAGGELPSDPDELEKLPGIGPYSAAAIASLAYGIPRAAIDGNVHRLYSRLFAENYAIEKLRERRRLQERLDRLIDPDRPGVFNEASIEMGALICRPENPLCESCPLSDFCRAYQEGRIAEFPAKKTRQKPREEDFTVLIVEDQKGRLYLEQGEERLLKGLYHFPKIAESLSLDEVRALFPPGSIQSLRELGERRHQFTHLIWHLKAIHIVLNTSEWPLDPSALQVSDGEAKAAQLTVLKAEAYEREDVRDLALPAYLFQWREQLLDSYR